MGCCFSKDLSSDTDSEKIGLLQKSVEEEEPENKISKTLSSLFDTLEGEEIDNVENGASRAAADLNMQTRVFVRSGHKKGPRPKQSLNSVSSSTYKFLTSYENSGESDGNSDIVAIEQNSESVCDLLLGSNERQDCSEDDLPLSCMLLHSDQSLQEEIFLGDHLHCCQATCKDSLIEKEVVVNVRIGSFNENNSSAMSEREIKNENYVCAGHKQSKNSRESEFYSICVVDPDCLNMDEELCTPMYGTAAGEECHSAVTSEGIHGVDWPLDNRKECSVLHALQGAEELKPEQEELSAQPMLHLVEIKEVVSEKITPNSEFLMDNNPLLEVNIGKVQANSFRTKGDTKCPKDYTESSTLHTTDLLPEFSLQCMCAFPEERESHSSGIGSHMGDSPINLHNDTSYVEENGEPEAITINVDQSLNCEKEGENNSIKLLKDNDYFHLNVNKSDSILSVGLDRINLSPQRCISSVSFGNEYLPVYTDFREAALGRLHDGPKSAPCLGDSRLETKSSQLAHRELSLQSGNNSSYQDEDRLVFLEAESHGEKTSELKSLCHSNMCVGSRVDKAETQTCDLTCVECEPDIEGAVHEMENPKLGLLQGIPSNGKSWVHSRSLQGVSVSSEEEERETGPSHKTEGEICVDSSVSVLCDQQGVYRILEKAEKESQKASCKEISKDTIEDVKSDSETTFDWKTSILKCKAMPGQDVPTCVSSSIMKNPDFEAYPIEKICETHSVNEHTYKDLNVLPPLSQSSNSVMQKSEVVENSVDSDESTKMRHIYTESTEEVSLAFGNNPSRLSKPKLIREEEEDRLSLEKDNVDPHIIDCLGSCGHAYHFKEKNANSTVKESTLNGDVHCVGNSLVIFGKTELCDASDGYSCSVRVDPTQVDSNTATPYDATQVIPVIPIDSKEIVVPSGDHVLPLTENTISIPASPSKVDWQNFPEEFYCQLLNEFSYYPMGGLTSQVFSERLEGGYGGYQVGYLCTNTITKDAIEDTQMLSGDLHRKPQDLDISSFSLQQTPYQLPAPEDGVIWGWQSRGGQLVSMVYQYQLLCCDMLVLIF